MTLDVANELRMDWINNVYPMHEKYLEQEIEQHYEHFNQLRKT